MAVTTASGGAGRGASVLAASSSTEAGCAEQADASRGQVLVAGSTVNAASFASIVPVVE